MSQKNYFLVLKISWYQLYKIIQRMDDIKIVAEIQNWDQESFIKLYDKYIQKIYNFIYYKCLDKKTTEDIVSETFLKAFENINKFDTNKKSKFSSRLYKIAYNNFVSQYNNWKCNIKNSWEWFEKIIEDKKDILDSLDLNVKIDKIKEFLENIWNEKKEIFIMKIWDELSYDEISNITKKSPANCRKIFSRTLISMQNKFWKTLIVLLFTM